MSFDVKKKGQYSIFYRVFFEDYQENVETSPDPFIVTVKDPCDFVRSLEAFELV